MHKDLEQRLILLEDFLEKTHDVWWFRGLLKKMLNVFDYRGKAEEEPAKTFYLMKEELRDVVKEEKRITSAYEDMMWKEGYKQQDGWNYVLAMAQEIRKMQGLPKDAHVHLKDGTREWKQASAKVLKEREKYVRTKREQVDKNQAIKLLIGLAKMRVDIYSQLVTARELLVSSWDLSQQDYYGSFTSGSTQQHAMLKENIREMISYVDKFPYLVSELVKNYPRKELIELRKTLMLK